MAANYTGRALSWSSRLVRAYTESLDGNLTEDVDSVLDEVSEHEGELDDLVASLAGLAGHAVMVIAARLEADLEPEDDPEKRYGRLLQQRTRVLDECIGALREFRPAILDLPAAAGDERPGGERRCGFDRRVGSNRRHLPPGSPSEKINLRLFGERRVGVSDRRSGFDRRSADHAPSGRGRSDEAPV
jgi:hypothetical protein